MLTIVRISNLSYLKVLHQMKLNLEVHGKHELIILWEPSTLPGNGSVKMFQHTTIGEVSSVVRL
jgi:hypothetical protein